MNWSIQRGHETEMFQATQSRWTTSGYDDRCLENEGARSPYSMSLFSGANENVDVKRSTQCLAHRAQGTRNAINDNNGGNRLPDTADSHRGSVSSLALRGAPRQRPRASASSVFMFGFC